MSENLISAAPPRGRLGRPAAAMRSGLRAIVDGVRCRRRVGHETALWGAAAIRRDGRAIRMQVLAVASGCASEITRSGLHKDQWVELADALTGPR
jgi:hypothetical protein